MPQSAEDAREDRRERIEEGRTETGERRLTDQMKEVIEEDLLTGVLGNLYEKLTFGNDDSLRRSNQFFAWNPVGTPMTADGLRFLKGMMGESAFDQATAVAVQKLTAAGERVARARERAEADGEDPEAAPDVLAAMTEADKIQQRERDTYERIEQAMQWATILNQIPNVPDFADDRPRAMVLYQSSRDVMDVYENVLRMCETASYRLTDEEKAKIERLRGLFYEQHTETDLITEEEVTKWRKTRLLSEYERTMRDYEAAEMEYQTLRADAASGTVPGAAMRFATQAAILRNRVRFAMDQWNVAGRKTDVERVAAYLESVGLRDAGLVKRDLLDRLRAGRLTSPMGGRFNVTMLTPSSFLDEEAGWSTFTFTQHASERSSSRETSSSRTRAGGFGILGIVSFGGGGSASSSGGSSEFSYRNEGFRFSCTYTMVNIDRGAPFDRSFLTSQMIRLPQGMDPICDGEFPPRGLMPALPTRAVLVKDLEMEIFFAEGEAQRFWERHRTSGGGGISFGGFGGFHAAHETGGSQSGSASSHGRAAQTLRSEGMQLAGYLCDILPKCPDPLDDPNLTWSAPDVAVEPELEPV